MFKSSKLMVFAAGLAALAFSARLVHAVDNGGLGTPLDDPPLTVGADWYPTPVDTPPAFYWGGGDDALNLEGPFTFNALGPVRLDVTDDFSKGDRFEVYDFGVSIGLTSLVPTVAGSEVGPEPAFNDPTYSSGSFILGAGPHSITLLVVQNPFDGGRGYLRAMPVVPEPHAVALGTLALSALLLKRRHRRRTF
jgi:hypothetical protein